LKATGYKEVRTLRKTLLLRCLFLAAAAAGFGQVSFSGLDLSAKDRLLFASTTRSPDFGAYDTLFLTDPLTKNLRQLTFFPEDALILQDKDVLQVQNRFGVFRTDPGFQKMAPLPAFPSFAGGSQIPVGRITPIQTSPNGRFLLFLRPRSSAFGDLVLLEVETGTMTILSQKVELSLQGFPAQWSPDSRFIIYGKSASLYYFSLTQLQQGRVMAEGLRRIGDGRIASVRWGANGNLYYISGLIVYAIDPDELFTRALYTGFLTIGKVRGKIPFEFDSNFDSYWVSPDGRNLLLNKGGRNLFLYALSSNDFHFVDRPLALPYLYLPRDTSVRRVLWSPGNIVTILCEIKAAAARTSTVYRLVGDAQGRYGTITPAKEEGVQDIELSPDGTKVALLFPDGVVVKDNASWEQKAKEPHPSPLHALWLGEGEILIAGAYFVERWNVASDSSTLIALSQPGEFGFANASDDIIARTRGRIYALDETAGAWKANPQYAVREKSVASENYRVFLQASTRGGYANIVMVRDVKGLVTTPLFPPETATYEAFPAKAEPVDFGNFTHGSRIRRREVSLAFNAIDSAEGLPSILNTLSAYKLRATFFVNGEFIRRFPDAVREIADSGHEVGSLFSAHFTMTDSRFTVDKDFVKAGLARNEDDYFAASGRELSLLWHAPYYIVNSEIVSAAAEMNYRYVGRDIDSYDWVTATEANKTKKTYLSASQLVERILSLKKPGSIIPLQVGMGAGGREDYLFQKLDLLVNELARLGYDIVPVSTLIENAR
jgi:peptidoglycan/xylan/chitin deacetylase (PgdA/CDA1 family)